MTRTWSRWGIGERLEKAEAVSGSRKVVLGVGYRIEDLRIATSKHRLDESHSRIPHKKRSWSFDGRLDARMSVLRGSNRRQ